MAVAEQPDAEAAGYIQAGYIQVEAQPQAHELRSRLTRATDADTPDT